MRAPRIAQLLLVFALILGTSAGAPGLWGSAFAESADGRGVEAFSRAVKAYEGGDLNVAAGAVDDAMQAGLSKELTARAIHLRAHISERSGALARALQDYSTALWMDTLPLSERKVAQEGKQRVIAAMGLNDYQPGGAKQASAAPEAAPQGSSGGGWSMFNVFGSSKSAASASSRAAARPGGRAAPQSSSGGVWGMFNVFGSSNPAPPAPAAPPVQAAEPAPPSAASTSASAVLTRKQAAARPPKPAAPPKAARIERPRAQPPVRIAAIQPAATPVSSASGFMILFGQAGSEGAGRTRAHQIKAALADILVNREVEVEAGADGGYHVVAGPYKAKAAALALCSAMKQRGVSCQVTP